MCVCVFALLCLILIWRPRDRERGERGCGVYLLALLCPIWFGEFVVFAELSPIAHCTSPPLSGLRIERRIEREGDREGGIERSESG